MLSEQGAGTVTVALLSKATNNNEMADSWFKDVTLTRTTTASEEPEPVYEEAERVAPEAEEGEARDAVGFKHEFTLEEGTTVGSLIWQVTCGDQTETVEGKTPQISGSSSCLIGLLITDLPENVDPEDISATVAIQ